MQLSTPALWTRLEAFGVLVVMLWCPSVFAQVSDRRNLDGNRMRPAMSREGIINVEAGSVAKHLEWDAFIWFDHSDDAFVLNQNDDRVASLLKARSDLHLVGSINLWGFAALALDVPITVAQKRGGRAINTLGLSSIDSAGLGDIALTPKVALLRDDRHGLDVALLARIALPTATPRGSYLGERTLSVSPELAVSKQIAGLTLAGNLATLLRDSLPEDSLALDVDHELIFRGGAAYDFDPSFEIPLRGGVTVEGFTALTSPFDSSNAGGAELLATGSYRFTDRLEFFVGGGLPLDAAYSIPDYRFFAGLRAFRRVRPEELDTDRDGVLNGVDRCPEVPEDPDGFEDSDGCPDDDNDGDGVLDGNDGSPNVPEDLDGFEDDDGIPEPDNDQDGVLDEVDGAPNQAEDLDGFQDADGVPDPDNDADGVPDVDDAAPDAPEDIDGFEDEDGKPDPDNDGDGVLDGQDNCPLVAGVPENNGCVKKQLVTIRGCKFDLTQKVYFQSGRDEVDARSFELLNNIFEVLSAQEQITRVRVEGHTDSRGSAQGNLRLSQARAEAVVRYLAETGIDAGRLSAQGFGEANPIASNNTAAGRETNRRVEFVIEDCQEVVKEVEVSE